MHPRCKQKEGILWYVLRVEDLEVLSLAQIRQELASVPADIRHFDLGHCALNLMEEREFRALLGGLRPGIRHLVLSDNALGFTGWGEKGLKSALTLLPEDLEALDFGANALNFITDPTLLSVLPQALRKLDLRFNGLGRPAGNLEQAMAVLPPGLECLGLAGNHLEAVGADRLVSAFQGLKARIKSLDLSGNQLAVYPVEALGRFFAVLPQSLQVLNLSETGIEGCEEIRARSHLPLSVRIIQDGSLGPLDP